MKLCETLIGRKEFTLDKINGHVENLYLEKIINITNLKVGAAEIVGDRNWCNDKGEPYYLGISKISKDLFAFSAFRISRNERKVQNDTDYYGKIGQVCMYEPK
ncbi:MAG: hypothetical protein LBI56_02145 [Puniceicoccales bacterium]|jgi:hypothetical protein|nr:hypothetical protein [Puniceicoccales bacterium]